MRSCTEPCGAASAKVMSATRARRLTNSAQRPARALVSADAPASTSGIGVPAAMFISARTERIARDQIDHPADLGFGLGVVEPVVLRPRRQHQQRVAPGPGLGGDAPQLLGDERHERMQQLEDFVERPGRHGARLVLGRAVRPGQHRLRQLEIPVAIDVPDEAIGRARRLVEPVGFDRLGDLARGLRGLVRDPAVERLLRRTSDRSPRPGRRRSSRRSARRSTAWSRSCGCPRRAAATA